MEIKKLLAVVVACLSTLLAAQQLDLRLTGATARASGSAQQPQLIINGNSCNLGLAAKFLNDSSQRACWDFPINENLTHCAGVKLRFYCHRPAIVRQFNLYIQAGGVWHSTAFTPVAANAWQEIFIPKARFRPEGNTTTWQKASCLRLALWKGATGATSIQIAGVEFVRPNCPVAIVRSGKNRKETAEAYRYADNVSSALSAYGLYPAVLEQEDTTYLNLRPYSLLFLPAPMAAGEHQLANLAAFIRRGGKVVAFHALPAIIRQCMKLPEGKYLSVPGLTGIHFQPYALDHACDFRQNANSIIAVATVPTPLKTLAVWTDANSSSTNWPAVIESAAGFWMTQVFLNKDPDNAPATLAAMVARFIPSARETAARTRYAVAHQTFADTAGSLEQKASARCALAAAREQFESSQFDASIKMSNDCIAALSEIGLPPMLANAREIRGIWCNHDNGLTGNSWATTAVLLENANINAVFMQGSTPLLANYKSRVAPRYKASAPLEKCVAACRANGLQVHAWLHCLSLEDSMHSADLQPVFKLWQAQGRLQVDSNGNSIPWLCPSQLRNRELVRKIAAEMALAHHLDGIHLDFIRFPQSNACLCESCRLAFERFTGRQTRWPNDVLQGGKDHQLWLAFRQADITSLVREIATAVRQSRQGIKVSAAVYPDLQSAMANVGQNWNSWIAEGIVDMVCPMDYQATAAAFTADIQRQKRLVKTPVQQLLPGIGVSVFNMSLAEAKRQIYATRQEATAGFILFKLDSREAQDILPNIFK